jgi:hypothetical protein
MHAKYKAAKELQDRADCNEEKVCNQAEIFQRREEI